MLRERGNVRTAEERLERHKRAVARARVGLLKAKKQLSAARKALQRSAVRRRWGECLALRREGLTYEEIGKRQGMSGSRARETIIMAEYEFRDREKT